MDLIDRKAMLKHIEKIRQDALYLLENNIEIRFRSGNDRYTLSVSKLVEGDIYGT